MRESLLPQLAGDLGAQIVVEEQVFLPAAREALADGLWLRSVRSRHREARQALERTLSAPVEGDEFARAIGELQNIIARHADEHSTELFPRLERALDTTRMRELALSMLSLYRAQVETAYLIPMDGAASCVGHEP